MLGLGKSHYNGKRGGARVEHDIKRNGFQKILSQVEMFVGGKRIIADFVGEYRKGKIHVFEAKFGSGKFTSNQKDSKAFNRGRGAHSNNSKNSGGTIFTKKGKEGLLIEPRQSSSKPATFHVLKYG